MCKWIEKIKELLSRATGAHRLGTVVRVFEIRWDSKSGLSLAPVVLRSVSSLTEFARRCRGCRRINDFFRWQCGVLRERPS